MFFHDHDYNVQHGGPGIKASPQLSVIPPPPMPSVAQMMENLKDDLVQIGKGILAGAPLFTEQQIKEERIATCKVCPNYTANGHCAKCGCVISVKAMLGAMKCPESRWTR